MMRIILCLDLRNKFINIVKGRSHGGSFLVQAAYLDAGGLHLKIAAFYRQLPDLLQMRTHIAPYLAPQKHLTVKTYM